MVREFARIAGLCSFLTGAVLCGAASGQSAWRPDKTVEIIIPTGAGGQNDLNGRLIAKSLQELKLVSTPVVVQNKTGGNQILAVVYLNQHAADPHYLLYSAATIFTNQIAGVAPQHYKDLTPLGLLLTEYTVISVKADSPIKTMRDLIERLKADPESLAFGVSARGGPNHLAVSQAMRSGGFDPKKLKLVVFKTNADSITSMMGGHIHGVVSSVSSAAPQAQAGNTRILAVAAPQRGSGLLANVPTMREQGIEAQGISNWRIMFGPKGMTAAQAAYWEDALARVAATAEWKQQLDGAGSDTRTMRGKELVNFLDSQYAATRAVMTDLGLAK
jgi:putative tricarboxylic transport membrane protein